MAAEVDALVGPTGQHNAGRTAVRHGVEQGYVYLGDRKVPVIRLPACGPPPVTKSR
jgi:hypothetical protein